MIAFAFLVLGLTVLGFGLISERVEGTSITGPMIFAAVGLVLGLALPLSEKEQAFTLLDLAAELTLAIVLFTDASRIRGRQLRREHGIPLRLLGLGLPLCIGIGALAARGMFPNLPWASAFVVSILLAPTDAALGQAVVEDKVVPSRIRQAINVESGLNDGIALPMLLMALYWAGHPPEGTHSLAGFGKMAGLSLVLGPLIGVGVGWGASKVVDMASQRGWISRTYHRLVAIGIALAAFGLAEVCGGNGFLAAFCAGLAVGNTSTICRAQIQQFANDQGQLLVAATFLMFGFVMLPLLGTLDDWRPFAYAAASLVLIRPLSVWLSQMGAGLDPTTILFVGWFGPRGLATVLYTLLVMERADLADEGLLVGIATATVAMSILAHGITAAPFSRSYGRAIAKQEDPDLPELEDVHEHPRRHTSPDEVDGQSEA